jgi:hypothetical protein
MPELTRRRYQTTRWHIFFANRSDALGKPSAVCAFTRMGER